MNQKDAIIIISHYNAWVPDQLIALLDQIETVPAGHPFCIRIIVNQAENHSLKLPDRHKNIEIYYRENSGYNIGAWNYGWQQPESADYYLFLQEECIVVKSGWLKAFVEAVAKPEIGLVGESLVMSSSTWEKIDRDRARMGRDPLVVLGQTLPWSAGMKLFMETHGIIPGNCADHLQSLILCTRRDVLEKIGGFRCGQNYDEAVCAEVAISKSVQAIGLHVKQIGFRPFEYILHPQWKQRREESQHLAWWIRQIMIIHFPKIFEKYLQFRNQL